VARGVLVEIGENGRRDDAFAAEIVRGILTPVATRGRDVAAGELLGTKVCAGTSSAQPSAQTCRR
jgi:hypothetical protein